MFGKLEAGNYRGAKTLAAAAATLLRATENACFGSPAVSKTGAGLAGRLWGWRQ